MKNKIILVVVLVVTFFLGMFTYRADYFPRPQLKALRFYFYPPPVPSKVWSIDKIITPYTQGVPLFIDRGFYDTIGDPRLEGGYVVQIPRHHKSPVEIELQSEVKIYRVLSDSNNNSVFDDWEPTDIKVGIRGASCVHSKVVSKIFAPGKVVLETGGPIASSPILIQETADTVVRLPITILNPKKLVKPKPH